MRTDPPAPEHPDQPDRLPLDPAGPSPLRGLAALLLTLAERRMDAEGDKKDANSTPTNNKKGDTQG
jgi:hypothetical protein